MINNISAKLYKIAETIDALDKSTGLGVELEKEVIKVAQEFNELYVKNPDYVIDKHSRERESFTFNFNVPKENFEEAEKLIKKIAEDNKKFNVKLSFYGLGRPGHRGTTNHPPYNKVVRGNFMWGSELLRKEEDIKRLEKEKTPEYKNRAKQLEDDKRALTPPGYGPDYFKYKGWEKDLKDVKD